MVDGGDQVVYGTTGGTVVNGGSYLYLEAGAASGTMVSSGVVLVAGTASATVDDGRRVRFRVYGGTAIGTR